MAATAKVASMAYRTKLIVGGPVVLFAPVFRVRGQTDFLWISRRFSGHRSEVAQIAFTQLAAGQMATKAFVHRWFLESGLRFAKLVPGLTVAFRAPPAGVDNFAMAHFYTAGTGYIVD